jgi:hypothetical protein
MPGSVDIVPALTEILFGSDAQGVRAPNPEVQGGYISLVATNNNKVEQPPYNLERMPSSLQEQIAFIQYVLKNKDKFQGSTPSSQTVCKICLSTILLSSVSMLANVSEALSLSPADIGCRVTNEWQLHLALFWTWATREKR